MFNRLVRTSTIHYHISHITYAYYLIVLYLKKYTITYAVNAVRALLIKTKHARVLISLHDCVTVAVVERLGF